MNPRPDAPRPADPTQPMLSDKQRLERFRNQVRNYPQWDAARYQNAVAGTFDKLITGNNEYMNTIYDAAAQNKPVVMFIGSGSDPATRHMIENSLKEARRQNGRDAVYAFVDLDRVDKNSAIGKYASENMPRRGQEPPFTMIFGVSRGDASTPLKADSPSFYRTGPVDQLSVNEAVSRVKLEMNGRFNMPRPQEQTQPVPRPQDQTRPVPRPQDQTTPRPELTPRPDTNLRNVDARIQESFAMSLTHAQRLTDKQAAYNSYKQAVDIADSVKNPAMQSAARVELGLACIKWGFPETGFKWIMEGGAKNPAIYDNRQNQPFKERLKQAGLPDMAVDTLILQGQRDPLWHTKDKDAGKKMEALLSVRPTPTVVPDKPSNTTPVQPAVRLRPSPFKR